MRCAEITEYDAILERLAGRDIVVCGGLHRKGAPSPAASKLLWDPVYDTRPTRVRGPRALPHFQPLNRPPDGHSFYETDRIQAARDP